MVKKSHQDMVQNIVVLVDQDKIKIQKMKNTLININGKIIDVRFISNISNVNFDTWGYSYTINTPQKTIKIYRNVEEDYDKEKLILYDNRDFTLEDFIRYGGSNYKILDSVFVKTKSKMEDHQTNLVKLRNDLLEQDDSFNYLDMGGFNAY